ncbi:MAG: hypothetical protein NTX87_19065 [Planctomycetota bacterium]|nr:hypothetical protein [Planctomycetota bacterium]
MRVAHVVMRIAGYTLLLGALALAASGCGPEYIYFRPAENPQGASPGWIAQGKYNLPPDTQSAEVEISARGVIEKPKKAEERRMMEVRFSVRNRGPAPWTLEPATVRIIDDEDRVMVGARAYRDKNPVGTLSVGQGTQATFLLVFDMPAGANFEAIGSLHIIWPYKYGDKAFTVNTKFVRIEEVTYYYPDYYGYPYYPPYYGPYPYGPYGPYSPYGPYYYDPWLYGPGPYGYPGYGRHRHH